MGAHGQSRPLSRSAIDFAAERSMLPTKSVRGRNTVMPVRAGLFLAGAVAIVLVAPAREASAQSLSYEFFKSNVQPIFLKHRPGHARCIVCHAGANNAMRLTPLAPGAANFTDEQSKTNSERASG